jgi:hypothetical protein
MVLHKRIEDLVPNGWRQAQSEDLVPNGWCQAQSTNQALQLIAGMKFSWIDVS